VAESQLGAWWLVLSLAGWRLPGLVVHRALLAVVWLGQMLIDRGLPAVVAMQDQITDR
jgi:predicted membrane-bound dolichyl-phosphate-mannose-protein mannosyltransferase